MPVGQAEILVVDDEPEIVEVLRAYLEREGFSVRAAFDGPGALAAFEARMPDLIVLDWMLPGMDGRDVCRQIRKRSDVPIIMLTARSDETDKLIGLEIGCDDYVTKPFSPREVVARVRAVLRRTRSPGVSPDAARVTPDRASAVAGFVSTGSDEPAPVVRVGELVVDPARFECRLAGRPLRLTPTEFKLLEVLASSPGRVFTRLQLVERVQGYAFEGYERTIDAHVKNLRQKLGDDPRRPRFIATVYGVGYKFVSGGEQSELNGS